MNELYWITRFDSIHDFCGALIVICSIIGLSIMIVFLARWFDEDYENMAICKKYLIIIITTILSTLAIKTFIPTTNDALAIYGIGSTIDYVKSNDTAKQLPDKAIQALDKYLDSINEDNK
jgi:hypothetical protein